MALKDVVSHQTRTNVRRRLDRLRWRGTVDFWEKEYAGGGNSGSGSYGRLAKFKAVTLNDIVARQDVQSVIEFGCGDGNQVSLASYPRYFGLDIASGAVETCLRRFADDDTKSFMRYEPALFRNRGAIRAEMAISLDVIFHLVEDDLFDGYMRNVFGAADRLVVIFSSNTDRPHPEAYTRHRIFTDWIDREAPEWHLLEQIDNPHRYDAALPYETSFADFWVFGRGV